MGQESHPSRVRELKLDAAVEAGKITQSHPSRVRELKHYEVRKHDSPISRTPPGCVN